MKVIYYRKNEDSPLRAFVGTQTECEDFLDTHSDRLEEHTPIREMTEEEANAMPITYLGE